MQSVSNGAAITDSFSHINNSYELLEDYSSAWRREDDIAYSPGNTISTTNELSEATPPALKKACLETRIVTAATNSLPTPCPVPTVFSQTVMDAIKDGKVEGVHKLGLIREAVQFYYGICPTPSISDYAIITGRFKGYFLSTYVFKFRSIYIFIKTLLHYVL